MTGPNSSDSVEAYPITRLLPHLRIVLPTLRRRFRSAAPEYPCGDVVSSYTTFLNQVVFTASPVLPVTLTNDSPGILVIGKIAPTSPFVIRPTAPAASVLE